MTQYKNPNEIFDFRLSDYISIGKVFLLLVFVLFATIIVYLAYGKTGSYDITRAMERHEDKILVETLAEIPKGPFLHRVVDKELNMVCYLNAVGGGLECYSLDEMPITDEKVMEKLKTQYNGYYERRSSMYNNSAYYGNKNTLGPDVHSIGNRVSNEE